MKNKKYPTVGTGPKFINNEMKNKKYPTVGTGPKFNRKIVDAETKSKLF